MHEDANCVVQSTRAWQAGPRVGRACDAARTRHPSRHARGARLWNMTSKQSLREDMTTAMRARDKVRTATLRMALAAVTNAEVAGKEAKELSDDEVQQVIAKEAKKRREAAQAYDEAGRTELADSERAELAVLEEYLPTQLTDDDLAALVADAITETGADGMAGMGQVMKAVQPKVAGRAEGGRVAAAVKRALQG